MKEHTMLEAVVERKNFYLGRQADNLANIIYFKKIAATQDNNTDGKVNALKAIKTAEDNIESDVMLAESFDELLENLRKQNNGVSHKIKKEIKKVGKK